MSNALTRRCAGLALAALLVVGAWTPARTALLEGTPIPDSARAFDQKLSLFSCGLREMLWTEIYAVAFYLPPGEQRSSAMWNPEIAKMIRVEIVFDGDIPGGLPSEWRKHLEELLERDDFLKFRDVYNNLKTGDVVQVAYKPFTGTAFTLNDDLVAELKGHQLVESLLRLWVGPEPVSKNLRRLLTRGGC